MAAKYILACLAVAFVTLGVLRMVRSGGRAQLHPQARAWLLVGVIFGLVAAYLFMQRP